MCYVRQHVSSYCLCHYEQELRVVNLTVMFLSKIRLDLGINCFQSCNKSHCCFHCIPRSPGALSGQGNEQDMLSLPSVTTIEKPLSKLLNPSLSQWSGIGPVVVLSGCTEQLPCVSVKQGVTENENLWFVQASTGWMRAKTEESSPAT